jgi:hypothetical protein
MNTYVFMTVMVIIIIDLLFMGITSAMVTNRINSIQDELKNSNKKDTVTYQAYGICQKYINYTVWCTWSLFGVALVCLIGYIFINVMSKSSNSEGGGQEHAGESKDDSKGEVDNKSDSKNSPILTLIFILAVFSLYFSTGFAIYTLMLLDWTNKIATFEKLNSIIGDKDGYNLTWITVIAGLVVSIPIFLWGVYEFYKSTK